MTNFEETLLREVATLPESRQADELAFIRFLKISIRDDEALEREFDEAIKMPALLLEIQYCRRGY
jgi:hypothetical protein